MAVRFIKPYLSGDTAETLLLRYLEAVEVLTRQRDMQGLSKSLIDILRPQVQAEHFRLLAISNPNKEDEFDESNVQAASVRDRLDPASVPVPIVEDKDLLACVHAQSRVLCDRPQGGRRLILPIFGARGVTALLAIEGLQELHCGEEVLTRLLQIYSNQAFLLSRSELDGLTGLYNRQSFDDRIKKIVVLNVGNAERRTRRTEAMQQSCLVLLDIDHFKDVNDRYGHLYGDEVLVQLSRLMFRSFRHEDLLFRYGGEEFAAVLAGVNPEIAVQVLEVFRQALEAYHFPQIGCKTVSIGVAGIVPGESVDTIINRADKALYYAKDHGRNQVSCYETLVAEGKLAPVTVATGDVELF